MKYSKFIFLCMAVAFFAACSNAPVSSQPAGGSPAMITPTAITASKSAGPTGLPSKASDGDMAASWASGEVAPQWIQFDLGNPSAISKIRLNTSQNPAGHTVHEIYGGETPDKLALLGTLDGNTADDQWLELPVSAKDIRYLKVNTKASSSWVSWREIQILR